MSLLADRYELKFVLSAEQRMRFLSLAGGLIAPDPFGGGTSYRVSSQYFDTPDLFCFREKLDGVSDRNKLRLRFYGEVKDAAAFGERAFFLEIKHRASETIHKERLRLTPAGARTILESAGELLDVAEHVVADDGGSVTVANVERLAIRRRLVAANVITYHREAWEGTIDPALRITFDTQIRALAPDRFFDVSGGSGAPVLAPSRPLLEVKFDQVIPVWVKDVLRALDLRPIRFSKYARGILALGAAGLGHPTA